MILLAPHLTAFLTERLPRELGASEHTRDAYSYSFMLLLDYVSKRRKIPPSALPLDAINAPMVLAFLEHLEVKRKNSARSRNARLAAIRSFARFLEYRVPEAIEQVRCLLAIPAKKTDQKLITYLTRVEFQAVLDAPDPREIDGLRDRAMLHLALAGGLRVSELVNLKMGDLILQGLPTVRILGKGRRERILPLWKETATAVRSWLVQRRSDKPEMFLNARGEGLTRAGFAHILKKHVATASIKVTSLTNKRVSPHILRKTSTRHTLTKGT